MTRSGSDELVEEIFQEVGYNRDVRVSEDRAEKELEGLERSGRTIVPYTVPGAKVYRDDRARKSLHLTDFRDSGEEGFGAHVERFNPEYHPVLHLVDMMLW